MSSTPKADIVGVGLNATDTLIPVHHYPPAGSKVEFRSANVLPGGQVATAIFIYFGATAHLPQIQLNWPAALALSAASLALLLLCGPTLHRTTRFH